MIAIPTFQDKARQRTMPTHFIAVGTIALCGDEVSEVAHSAFDPLPECQTCVKLWREATGWSLPTPAIGR